MRKKALYLLFIPLLLFLFLFPKISFQASCEGINLWWNTVVPSLLPFIILSNLLVQTNLIEHLLVHIQGACHVLLGTSPYGAYAWALGLLCGFPMGAKLTADFYLSGRIDREEADYLLMVSNHASPMFIINYVVLSTLGDENLLKAIMFILYGSALLSGGILRVYFGRFHLSSDGIRKKEVSMTGSTGAILDTSIMNGFETITRLGGYIILFSIYGTLLRKVLMPFPTLQAFIAGITEITTGINCIHNSPLTRNIQLLLILCCTSFGGISTLAQTNCVIQESGLSIHTYLQGKLLNAAVTSILAFLFIIFF